MAGHSIHHFGAVRARANRRWWRQLRSLVAGLEFSVSYTTRALRGSEENGREYYFTNRPTFERMIANDEFLEWAEVFGKDYYGTARTALSHARATGKDLLLDIDVQGAAQVMDKLPEAVSIFVVPPSPEVLERRLQHAAARPSMELPRKRSSGGCSRRAAN